MKFAKYVPGKHLFRSRKSLSPSPSSTPASPLPGTPPDVYFDVREAFEMIDRDGDGMIKMEDLDRLTCRIGGGEEEDLKSASSGCISLEEFCEIAEAFAPPACDREIREAFDFFDSDRDGRITAEELFGFFGDAECTLEDCRRMIRGVDRSGDGFVCLEDFTRMMDAQQSKDGNTEQKKYST